MITSAKNSLVNPRTRHGLELRTCSIVAVASYLPERVLTNADVGKRIGEDGNWILPRTGIRERLGAVYHGGAAVRESELQHF